MDAGRRRAAGEAVAVFVLTLGLARIFYEVDILQKYIPILFLYIPLIIMMVKKDRPEEYGLTFDGSRAAARDVAVLCAVFFPPFVAGFHIYQTEVLHARFHPALPRGLMPWAAAQLFLVAFPEEFLYRGYLQGLLNRAFGRPWSFRGVPAGPGLVIADALFAAAHVLFDGNPLRANVFAPGLLFGWLREKGGLAGPVVFHALCNIFVRFLEASYRA